MILQTINRIILDPVKERDASDMPTHKMIENIISAVKELRG